MVVGCIARNELRRLFLSPLSWIMLALVQFLGALFLFMLLSSYLEQSGVWQGQGITEIVVAGMLQLTGMLLLLVTPILTMRLFSEEQRNQSLVLLLGAPISITEIVLGKYLGILSFMLCHLLIVTLLIGSLWLGTPLDPGQVAAGLAGLFLLICTLCAVGMFFSSLTRQPAVAAAGSFACLFVLWILSSTGAGVLAPVVSYLSMPGHYQNLLTGMFSTVDVGYYVILSLVFILLSIRRLDDLRRYS